MTKRLSGNSWHILDDGDLGDWSLSIRSDSDMRSPIRRISVISLAGSSTDSSPSANGQILDLTHGDADLDQPAHADTSQSSNDTSGTNIFDNISEVGVSAHSTPIRSKRHWTVVRTFGERNGRNGKEHKVAWADTPVPGHCIKYTKRAKRAYVEADHERHYIAEKSTATVDAQGRVWFKCRWKHSFIPDHLMDEVQRLPSERPPSELRFPWADEVSDDSSTPHESIETECAAEAPRESTAASALTFSDLDRGYPDSLRFQATSSLINYGPGVQALIERELGKTLITTGGAVPSVVQRRIQGHSVRPLQIRDFFVNRRGHYINLRLAQNAEAALVHMQGDDVLEPCSRCSDGKGIFQGCVVGDAAFGSGECTNCHYGSLGNRCSFRVDTNDERGHTPARRILKDVQERKRLASRRASYRLPESSPPSSEPPQSNTPASSDLITPASKHSPVLMSNERPRFRMPACSDFILPSSGHDSGLEMSGGLGPRSDEPPPGAMSALSEKVTQRLAIRKRQKSSCFEEDQGATVDIQGEPDVIPSDPPTASKSSMESQTDLPAVRGSSSAFTTPFHDPAAFNSSPPTSFNTAMVYRSDRFEPGELRMEQLQYIYGQCNDGEKIMMKRKYKDAKDDGEVDADRSFLEFYSTDEPRWLRRKIIKVVCRGKRTVDLEDG